MIRQFSRTGLILLLAIAFDAALGIQSDDDAEARQRAAAAMQRGDYAVAYCTWQPLAQKGSAEAQFALGWMFHNGYGLAIDDRAAVSWWQQAVEQGHLEATFSLGSLYSLGSETVVQDYAAAMKLWAQAAEEGHEDAQLALRQLMGRELPEIEQITKELLAERPRIFGEPKEVKVSRANVRNGPGVDHRIIAVVEGGSPVVEFLRHDDWTKIGTFDPPRVGWIYAPLIGRKDQLAAGFN